uniref:Probable replication factor A 73 kDa subunit (inferred by orthology to a C. elegans protein) n=1 Tax=Strongyloides venezuelensis TaxID=75913 RepID=A0A0K0F8C4_STRVS
MCSDVQQEYELSRGFFQLLAEDKVDGLKPVFQKSTVALLTMGLVFVFVLMMEFSLMQLFFSWTEGKPLEKLNFQFPTEEVRKVDKNVKNESSEYDTSVAPIISISLYLIQWKFRRVVSNMIPPQDINTPKGPVSFFGDMVTQLDRLIKVSSSYTIKRNNKVVKTSNKRYNNTGHEYEITLRNDVEIVKIEVSIPLPAQKFNRVSLSKIKMLPGESVDIIVVVDSMEEAINVSAKNGMAKRMNIFLIDELSSLVKLTVWGDSCNEFTEELLHKPIT